jgi:hypothetical protein
MRCLESTLSILLCLGWVHRVMHHYENEPKCVYTCGGWEVEGHQYIYRIINATTFMAYNVF